MAAPLLPPVPDLAAYRRLRGDPAPWLAAVEVICERHGLDAEHAYLERTGTNVVFRVAGGPWIKLYPPPFLEDALRERTGLRATQGLGGLALPQLRHEGELEGWPYLVLTHLEGHPAGEIWSDLPREAQTDVARQLGEVFARLHASDPTGCDAIREEDWPAYAHGLWADAVERQVGHGLGATWVADLERVLEALGPPPVPAREVLLHADVTDDHVMLEERAGRWRVTGLIDFGDAMLGDPDYEFAAPLVFLAQRRPAVQRALLEGYGVAPVEVDTDLGRRLVRWCLIHRYGQIPTFGRFAPEPRPTSLDELVAALWCPARAGA